MLSERQLLSPCVWDCYSMRAVEIAGFDCALLSGAAVSESLTGIPDLGLITVDELIFVAERIAHFASIPLLVDFDEGYVYFFTNGNGDMRQEAIDDKNPEDNHQTFQHIFVF